jgi:hypothetical protein
VVAGDCTFVFASWVDLIHVFYLPTLVCFFLFIRSEYLRNMEECIWTTVSQIQVSTHAPHTTNNTRNAAQRAIVNARAHTHAQDTFDFRRF